MSKPFYYISILIAPFAAVFLSIEGGIHLAHGSFWAVAYLVAAIDVAIFSLIVHLVMWYRAWNAIQDGHARTTPLKAVALLLVPLFNIYWFFHVFWGFAKDYNEYVVRYRIPAYRLPQWLFLAYSICILFFLYGWPLLMAWPFVAIATFALQASLIGRVCSAVDALSKEPSDTVPFAAEPRPKPFPDVFQAIGLLLLMIVAWIVFNEIAETIYSYRGSLFSFYRRASWVDHVILAAAMTTVLFYGYKKTRHPLKKVFPLGRFRPAILPSIAAAVVGLGFLGVAFDTVVTYLAPNISATFDSVSGQFPIKTGLVSDIAFIVLVIPLLEELMFRGLFLHGFLQRHRATTAIILSGLLFGLVHIEPLVMVNAALMGFFLGWVFVRTGNLFLCFFAHAFNNAIPTILRAGGDSVAEGAEAITIDRSLLIVIAIGVALLSLGIWTVKRFSRTRLGTDTTPHGTD